MSDLTPDHAEEAVADFIDDVVPSAGYQLTPMVGLGGSAGAIPALQDFFQSMPKDPGMAFVVILHLAPDHESNLAEILQRCTSMPVIQACDSVEVQPNAVYVIPPRKAIRTVEGHLSLADDALTPRGRHVAVDLFFRTLADTYGPHAAAVVLSGADGDGAIGIKRIKERGGLTVAQDPQEAEQAGMPRSAIASGMVDWVLPVGDIAQRLLAYFGLEKTLKLPPEDGPHPALLTRPAAGTEEAALRDVLVFLRTRTGRDFSYYKRATVVRRIARRMQVNGVEDLLGYLDCLRTRPGEAGALLQDMLISVTNFFRDADCFQALEGHLEELCRTRAPNEAVRVWVPACATGEEAYSLAILLCEKTRQMEAPPLIQVFATDLDEEAIRTGREAIYPTTIEADVSEEQLRRYFVRDHRGYRVRREVREMVLFAQHDLLKDSPFSRLDLISCRNLLIYLNREAQKRAFEIFHFALLPEGRLFLGASESAEDVSVLFSVLDKKNRIFVQRPTPRMPLPVPAGRGSLALALEAQQHAQASPAIAGRAFQTPVPTAGMLRPLDGRTNSWGELHFKLLEALAPPSVLVDADHEILHLSPSAGTYLQFTGGEPTRNLLRSVHPSLRIELRATLYQAAQTRSHSEVTVGPVELSGQTVEVVMRVALVRGLGADMFVVMFNSRQPGSGTQPDVEQADKAGADPVAHHLDRELERLKAHLRDTVEQYEASNEELKASNEELQAMNEELRSATEELETSREELQSINEELTTVNYELKSKVDELGHSNSDMHNLMDATAIATVFLDRELRITRYTPEAVALFNLITTDLGRPLADLATRLDYPELSRDALRVLKHLVPIEREVGLPDGQWFLARSLPYRTIEDHIAGVVVSFIDITERKQAEEVRLWLSAVVASSSDAILSFAMDQTILSWNAGAERVFGYSAAEAIGQPMSMLGPDEDERRREHVLGQLREGHAISNLEVTRRRKDGTDVMVALSISPIRDTHDKVIGGTAIARDITQQNQAAEALRSSEERLRLVVENATEYAIFSTDLQRRVTIWNAGAQRLLGYAESEVLGEPADIIFTPEDRAAGAPEHEMHSALKEGRASDDRLHQRKDGSRFWASGAMMLMRDALGQAVGFVKILRDQTAARETQQALERSQTELMRALEENERARTELQTADAAKDRFLAVLSHELRNPLASIDSAAALMLMQDLPLADREAAAHVVKRQARAMKSLLDDLLDVSRLKLGRLQLQRETVRLSSVVEAALETTRPMLEAVGHRLKVDIPSYPIEMDADPLRLGQVISNLLTNSIKYTQAGGTITLKARLEGKRAVISVSDNGIGMDPMHIERMFEMFTQEQPVADRSHGLGIGLALVKSIVEMHGGRIEAFSAGPGKGSEFRVTLPAVRGSADVADTPPAPVTEESAAKPRGLILIADDNVDAGWGIAKLLELAGFSTVRVKGGVEAVKETRRHKPDVGIVDIGMPDLSGHEVARQIRQTEWGKHMVLIAATGWGQESDEREAMEAGFDAHMTKPVDLRKLSAVVDDLLTRKRD
ncbi:chemotaxis protein CheB [Caenimonas soli]|uniref:chemotaxis protein CheB n=1 Tax=Caenimonas soli TaxID=2735555 RepID=UPI001555FAF8|nr:chemotaxis protein CheB [Caenimonas soli]NPC58689.1 PAS domain S-box protein [Caenimonas soli]